MDSIYLWEWHDGIVYIESWIVRKYYQKTLIKILSSFREDNSLSKDELDHYHQIMNNLSNFTFIIDEFEVNSHKHNIIINFLELWNKIYNWSKIENKEEIIITEVPYVEWDDIEQIDFYSHTISYLLQKKWITNWYLKISECNIKVLQYHHETKEIHLMVTDIADNIRRFLKTQSEAITKRTNENKNSTYIHLNTKNNSPHTS